jgi:Arc/MetJ family transcription regulator
MDPMKTHMDIDAGLLANAMKLGGHRTKREAVETALQRYVRWRARQELLALRGKVKWVGNLDQMRGRSRPSARK